MGIGARLKGWNWWKIGFFAMLLVFEVTRELLVISATSPAEPATIANFFNMDGFVSARGQWRRVDGGADLVPALVTIECRRERGVCAEASVHSNGSFYFAPDVTFYDAVFTPDAVTYSNDQPLCARYDVRIDLRQERVLSTRTSKPGSPEHCKGMERRIPMELGDSKSGGSPFEGHFVPILAAVTSLAES